MYCLVNIYSVLPGQYAVENLIMTGVLFAVLLFSYFRGIMAALGAGAVLVFCYGSYVLYTNIILGRSVGTQVYFWMVFLPVASTASAMIGGKIRVLQDTNRRLRKEHEELVMVDPETGLDNARVFYNVLTRYMGLSKRHNLPLTLVLVKLIYYEDIEAIAGEKKMRDIMKHIGEHLGNITRTEDGSYMLEDGQTFALLLFTDARGAEVVRNRLKDTIKDLKLDSINRAVTVKVDFKVGIAQYGDASGDVLELRKIAEKDMEYDV